MSHDIVAISHEIMWLDDPNKVWCGIVKCGVYRKDRGIWKYSVECVVNKYCGRDIGIWEYSVECAGNKYCRKDRSIDKVIE